MSVLEAVDNAIKEFNQLPYEEKKNKEITIDKLIEKNLKKLQKTFDLCFILLYTCINK